jgi:hypothetical protein
MTDWLMGALRRMLTLAVLCAAGFGVAGVPQPAQARVWVGFGSPFLVAPPVYYPPPAYYPPPTYYPPPYYAPPPMYSPPPVSYNPPMQYSASSQSCIVAGTSVCPMEHPVASDSSCYCTTSQGRVWGRAT